MVIVEGLDNTGKTTLVHAIKAKFPILEVRPSIGNHHDPKQIKRQAHEESVHFHVSRLVVSDRSRILSEWVYNPILQNRPMAYDMPDWLHMMGGFAQGAHLVIYTRRSLNEIVDSWAEDTQLEDVFPNLFKLNSAYEKEMAWLTQLFNLSQSGGKVIEYEFITGVEYVMQNVEQYIAEVAG